MRIAPPTPLYPFVPMHRLAQIRAVPGEEQRENNTREACPDPGQLERSQMGRVFWLCGWRIQFPRFGVAEYLYVLCAVICVVAMVLGISEALNRLHEANPPTVRHIVMGWLLTAAFGLKLPYLYDKILAFITVGVLGIGYAIMTLVDTINGSKNGG